ncbi:MAG: S8 family serine peptidase [Longimicrobiales bacterium]|nr:S8 family serine peptidase [Longimicrobiales bacterium]
MRTSRVGPAITTRSASIRGGSRLLSARIGAALALLLLAGSAGAQDLSRADPALQFLLLTRPTPEGAETGVAADRAPAVAATPAGLLGSTLERHAGGVRVRTLVRVGPGGEAALRAAGAEVRARAGDIVTASIPLDAVPALLSEDGIRMIELAMPLTGQALRPSAPEAGGARGERSSPVDGAGAARALSDSANADSRFDALRRRAGSTWEGLAGQGVIIGVYDSGLDLTHGDFLDPDGGTRVLFAWDQTDSVSGSPPGTLGPNQFDYGVECTTVEIDAGECAMVDRVGHGTHVTGTAAADGSATGRGRPAWRFPGGAPGADLIVVKGGDGSYSVDRLIDGVAYIFARAEALGRPAVVNISLSALGGPHDGTTLPEQALNAMVGPGRIVVAGAGNTGDFRNTDPVIVNGPNHAEGSGGGIHGVRVPPYAPRDTVTDGLLLELWYEGADSLSITVTSPRGAAITATTGTSATLVTGGGEIAIVNALDGPSPLNGDHAAVIGIGETAGGVLPDTGLWRIDVAADALHASGRYHLWIAGSTLAIPPGPPLALTGGTSNRYLVGVPASADRVIGVGAHVTRHQWEGVDGPVSSPARESMGDIGFFSSPGPRRDGVQKPDLTAPGKVLISSFGKDATLWDDYPWLVEGDSVHVGLFGTSTSAPQVTAAAAILLQLEPELTPEEVEDALTLSAATDALVASPVPNPVWGAGKLDAAAAADRLRPDGLAGPGQLVNLSENPVRGDALVINYSRPPTSVTVYTLVAERVRSFSGSEVGPLSTIWPLDTDEGGAVANGVYVVVVEFPDRQVVRKVFVARP